MICCKCLSATANDENCGVERRSAITALIVFSDSDTADLLRGHPERATCNPICSEDTMQTDPVCNMQIDEQSAAGKVNHNGKDYYFCSQQCADKFRSNPQQYTKAA